MHINLHSGLKPLRWCTFRKNNLLSPPINLLLGESYKSWIKQLVQSQGNHAANWYCMKLEDPSWIHFKHCVLKKVVLERQLWFPDPKKGSTNHWSPCRFNTIIFLRRFGPVNVSIKNHFTVKLVLNSCGEGTHPLTNTSKNRGTHQLLQERTQIGKCKPTLENNSSTASNPEISITSWGVFPAQNGFGWISNSRTSEPWITWVKMVATTPLQKQEITTLVSVLICVYIYYYILYNNTSMFSPGTHTGIWKILRHVHTTTQWFSNDFSVNICSTRLIARISERGIPALQPPLR